MASHESFMCLHSITFECVRMSTDSYDICFPMDFMDFHYFSMVPIVFKEFHGHQCLKVGAACGKMWQSVVPCGP